MVVKIARRQGKKGLTRLLCLFFLKMVSVVKHFHFTTEHFIPTLVQGDDNNDAAVNGQARRSQSPIHQSCKGLPPLCVVTSEHEAVYDMTCILVNRARSEGVPVTMGVWKCMCHVFSILHGFLPEGQISMDFVVEWIQERQAELQKQAASEKFVMVEADVS